MNIFSQNCRGLRQSSTVQGLTALVRAKSPSLVYLMEPHRSAQRAMNLKWRLGLKHLVGIDSVGQSGGLVLFWHESLEVVLLGLNHHIIDIKVKDVSSGCGCRITFIYGGPRVERHHLMWETLQRLCDVSDLSWMVVGDFNEAMWGFEHFFANHRHERQMVEFQETFSFCDLHDLGFSRLPYTWDNGGSGGANVWVRLDRAVENPAWRDMFNNAKVHHLISSRSDHCPALVELCKDDWRNKGLRAFRYEVMWERVVSLSDEIKNQWCSSADQDSLSGLSRP
jgi:hypothetical protein